MTEIITDELVRVSVENAQLQMLTELYSIAYKGTLDVRTDLKKYIAQKERELKV
jgi:hypothetical protein